MFQAIVYDSCGGIVFRSAFHKSEENAQTDATEWANSNMGHEDYEIEFNEDKSLDTLKPIPFKRNGVQFFFLPESAKAKHGIIINDDFETFGAWYSIEEFDASNTKQPLGKSSISIRPH